MYLLLIILPAEDDEEYEETEDEDDKAEEDGGDEAEDDIALLCEICRAWGGVSQGQGLAPVTARSRTALSNKGADSEDTGRTQGGRSLSLLTMTLLSGSRNLVAIC